MVFSSLVSMPWILPFTREPLRRVMISSVLSPGFHSMNVPAKPGLATLKWYLSLALKSSPVENAPSLSVSKDLELFALKMEKKASESDLPSSSTTIPLKPILRSRRNSYLLSGPAWDAAFQSIISVSPNIDVVLALDELSLKTTEFVRLETPPALRLTLVQNVFRREHDPGIRERIPV